MACNSLVALPRSCQEGVMGGIQNSIYMIAYKDLTLISGGSDVYTINPTTNTVSEIGVTTTKFVNIDLLKSTSGLEEKLTKDLQKGTNFFSQTFKLVLGDITPSNVTFLQSVINQPVSIIYKTRTGNYFVVGLNGQFELKTATGGTGIGESDMNGYTLEFEGIGSTVAPLLDSSILPDIVA